MWRPDRNLIWSLLATVVLGVAVSASVALYVQDQLHRPYRSYGASQAVVEIPKGYSVSQIAEKLEAEGAIGSAQWFRWYVRFRDEESALKAGEYHFDRPMSLVEVAEKLRRGQVYLHRMTVPEGLDLQDTVKLLASRGFGDRQQLLALASDPAAITDLDPQAEDLEGYLYPSTYHWSRDLSEVRIIDSMVENLRAIWTPERRQRAQEIGMSLREVVTLASLIEKETGLASERRLISAVFHNRLAKQMNLACDPTVIYAVKRIKPFDGIIHQSDLKLDSPYNTYIYPGLPPGPIANPGAAAIDAALEPAEADYLFFVSRNDGSHVFSSNYRDHHRAVLAFQR